MIEIHPGYGAPGITQARYELLNKIRTALAEIVGTEAVILFGDVVVVRLGAKAHLRINPWSSGTDRGYRPAWLLQESQGGLLPGDVRLSLGPPRKVIRRLLGRTIEVLSGVELRTTPEKP